MSKFVGMLDGLPLDSVRAVLTVKADKNGCCHADRMGAPGTALMTYNELCRQKSLPICLVSNPDWRKTRGSEMPPATMSSRGSVQGLQGKDRTMAKKRRRRSLRALPPLDLPPMEDIDGFGLDFGALKDMFNKDSLLQTGGVMLGGAAGGIVQRLAVERVGSKSGLIFDKPWKVAGLSLGIGLVGGRLLWGSDPSMPSIHDFKGGLRKYMALGVMGAMGSSLGVMLANRISVAVTEKPLFASALFGLEGDDPTAALMASPEDELLGLGDTEVEEKHGFFGQADVEDRHGFLGQGDDEIDVSEPSRDELTWLA